MLLFQNFCENLTLIEIQNRKANRKTVSSPMMTKILPKVKKPNQGWTRLESFDASF